MKQASPYPFRLAFLVAACVAAELCHVELEDVLRRGAPGTLRRRRVRTARALALYLTVTSANARICEAARAANRSKRRVSHLCHQVEDRRDDPQFDALVTRAEHWFAARYALPSALLAGEEKAAA